MQSGAIISWKADTDNFRSFVCSSIVPLAILSVMIISILPALASQAFATNPVQQNPNGRATAVASAKVIKPFTMNAMTQAESVTPDSVLTVLRRTTLRSCETLLGKGATQVAERSCELRLIELQ